MQQRERGRICRAMTGLHRGIDNGGGASRHWDLNSDNNEYQSSGWTERKR